jgi:hypothetical protein
MIDRRELLAVATATAAAAVVPALPARAAPLIRSGVMMTGGRLDYGVEPEWVAFHARWHFQKWPDGRTICHCDTGLMFAATILPDNPFWVYELIRPADMPPLPVDARRLGIIGCALSLACRLASGAGGQRREAFFYRFSDHPHSDKKRIADAPPLPFFG